MLRVLLVEDNLGDQRLALEAFKQSQARCDVEVTADGGQALTALSQAGSENRLPDLILLDLNLPRIDGREVLSAIKSNPQWRHIPVLILSSSTSPQDIAECYERQANCYLIKPMDIEEFFAMIKKVEELWFPPVERVGHTSPLPKMPAFSFGVAVASGAR